jgi:hypothetical protein
MQTHESSVPSLCSEFFTVSIFKVHGMRPPMKGSGILFRLQTQHNL